MNASYVSAADIKHCKLSRKGLTSDTVQKAFKLFVNAEMVDVSHNQISFLRSDLLPSSILTLDLSHNLFTRIMGLDRLSNMTHLNLRCNLLQSTWGLLHCTRLKVLDLSGNSITIVAGMEQMHWLEHLNLAENCIQELEDLRPLSLLGSLSELVLEGNPVCETRNKDGDGPFRALMLHLLPGLAVLNGVRMSKSAANQLQRKKLSMSKANSYSSLYKSKRFGEQQSYEILQHEPQAQHMHMLYEGRDHTGTYGNSDSNIAVTGTVSGNSPRRRHEGSISTSRYSLMEHGDARFDVADITAKNLLMREHTPGAIHTHNEPNSLNEPPALVDRPYGPSLVYPSPIPVTLSSTPEWNNRTQQEQHQESYKYQSGSGESHLESTITAGAVPEPSSYSQMHKQRQWQQQQQQQTQIMQPYWQEVAHEPHHIPIQGDRGDEDPRASSPEPSLAGAPIYTGATVETETATARATATARRQQQQRQRQQKAQPKTKPRWCSSTRTGKMLGGGYAGSTDAPNTESRNRSSRRYRSGGGVYRAGQNLDPTDVHALMPLPLPSFHNAMLESEVAYPELPEEVSSGKYEEARYEEQQRRHNQMVQQQKLQYHHQEQLYQRQEQLYQYQQEGRQHLYHPSPAPNTPAWTSTSHPVSVPASTQVQQAADADDGDAELSRQMVTVLQNMIDHKRKTLLHLGVVRES